LSEFYPRCVSLCKLCRIDQVRAYEKANPEKVRKLQREKRRRPKYRQLLMRVQRHISQAEWDGRSPGTNPQFKTDAGEEAFFTVERLLIELESEFDAKVKTVKAKKRRALHRRADRQVER